MSPKLRSEDGEGEKQGWRRRHDKADVVGDPDELVRPVGRKKATAPPIPSASCSRRVTLSETHDVLHAAQVRPCALKTSEELLAFCSIFARMSRVMHDIRPFVLSMPRLCVCFLLTTCTKNTHSGMSISFSLLMFPCQCILAHLTTGSHLAQTKRKCRCMLTVHSF